MIRFTRVLSGAALAGLMAITSIPAMAQAPAADTMAAIRARGQLICSTSPSTVGFSLPDSQGVWRGLDVDYCRAVAAAILGDPNRVRIVPSSTQQRFTMLQSGEIDMLSRTTTWTLTREASLGDGMRAARHHHRTQHDRFLPHQSAALHASGDREYRRNPERLHQ